MSQIWENNYTTHGILTVETAPKTGSYKQGKNNDGFKSVNYGNKVYCTNRLINVKTIFVSYIKHCVKSYNFSFEIQVLQDLAGRWRRPHI